MPFVPCMGLTETAGGWNDGCRMGGKGAGRYRCANMPGTDGKAGYKKL